MILVSFDFCYTDLVTDQFPENSSAAGVLQKILPSTCVNGSSGNSSTSTGNNSLFENIFNSARLQPHTSSFSDFICAMAHSETPTGLAQGAGAEPTSLSLSSSNGSSFFGLEESGQFAAPQPPTMSATALLQKAAQMGAAATSGSFLRSFGVSMSSSSGQDNSHWNGKIDGEHSPPLSGLSCDGNSRLTELMMAPSTLFGPEPTTLDFLGLGMAGNGSSKGGYSALISSIDSELDIAAASTSFGARDL